MAKQVRWNSVPIKNVGLFWQSDRVFWGKPGDGGKLLGRLLEARKGPVSDFWDQRGIYALYRGYDLVYVGKADQRSIGDRLRDHRRDHLTGRWDRFSWFGFRNVNADGSLSKFPGVLPVNSSTVLTHMEALLIMVAEPPMNGQSGQLGNRVEWFEQVPADVPSDPNIATVQHEVEALSRRIEEISAHALRPNPGSE